MNVFTDNQLAALVANTNDHAAITELLARYEPMIRNLAFQYGSRDGIYSMDDVRQDLYFSLIAAAHETTADGVDFTKAFSARSIEDLKVQKDNMRDAVSIPAGTVKTVIAAIRQFDGDTSAARDYLSNPSRPAHRRVTVETFVAVCNLVTTDPVGWDSPTGKVSDEEGLTFADVTADPNAVRSFQSIEDRDQVEQLLSTLSESWQEVVARTHGLRGHLPQTSKEIGAIMGLHDAAVRRIQSKATARLLMNSDDPRAAEPAAPRRTAPIHSNSPFGGTRSTRPSRFEEFPVHTRLVGEERTEEIEKPGPGHQIRTFIRVDHTLTTGILAGNEAWGNVKRRDYDAPKRTRADHVDTTSSVSSPATGSPLGEEIEARIAAIKARRAAKAKAESEDFKNFLKRLGA